MSQKYVLAVDGGGSKTKTIAANFDGQIIGEGLSGPTSLATTTIGAASFNLKESVRQALENISPGHEGEIEIGSLVMGLAGMDTPHEYQQAKQIFEEVLDNFKINNFFLVNDSQIALRSGTDQQDAVVIIAGTGSICYGRNSRGEEARTGGMDQLLTDQGSGYMIGRQVLRDAVKSFDGRRPKSILEDLVSAHFGISSIADLKEKVYNPDLTKTEVAALAIEGLQALEKGDELARAIFDHAKDSLVVMAQTVIKRLGIQQTPVDCVMTGRIMSIPYIHDHFIAKMNEFHPQLNIIRPHQEPVFGALKMALELKEFRNLVSPGN